MTKTPMKLAKAIRLICDYSLGGALVWIAAFSLWILWFLVAPMVTGSPGKVPDVGIWVGAGQGPPGLALPVAMEFRDGASISSAGLYNTTGKLRFKTNDRRIQIFLLLDNVVLSLLILGLVYMARQFLVDVIDGRTFTFENAKRLKWIGWFLLGISLFKPLFDKIAARWIFSIVTIQSPTLHPPLYPNVALILVALFILILSAAFRHGVELEKDRSLTV